MTDLFGLGYYAIDWLAMTLTFIAIYLLGNKSRLGFVLMSGGNCCWAVVGLLTGSLAMLIANLVFLVMNVRAWVKWTPVQTGT